MADILKATRIPHYLRIFRVFQGSIPMQLRSFSSNTLSHFQMIMEKVAQGKLLPSQAAKMCQVYQFDTLGEYAKIDSNRSLRTGFPEVVYAEGKTPDQIAGILQHMHENKKANVLATRVSADLYQEIYKEMKDAEAFTYYKTARILASKKLDTVAPSDSVDGKEFCCVLCAGTSDLPIAEEAAITLELAGYTIRRLYDVGVAGIHRLLQNLSVLDNTSVVICVAGMDGALPGVVGGLTHAPVIAVPTSIGYGACFGGVAPLLTMLNSCSPGVGVVNIDNGFGAAVLAARILKPVTQK